MKSEACAARTFLGRDTFGGAERSHENRCEFLGFAEKVVQLLGFYDSSLTQQLEPENGFIRLPRTMPSLAMNSAFDRARHAAR